MLKVGRKNKNLSKKKNSSQKEHTRRKWCVLFGYNVDNISNVGYLAFTTAEDLKTLKTSKVQTYKIVSDVKDAVHFPCENYSGNKDFAKPEKWLEFFEKEYALRKWKFHLVTRLSTN